MKRKCKWIAAVLVLILCLSACGGEKAPAHCGTWTVSSLSFYGVEFSGEQLETLGMNEVQDFRLVLTSDGKAYIVDGGKVEQAEWHSSDGGLQIGALNAALQENRLTLDFGSGIVLFLEKKSNSQAVPAAQSAAAEATVPETTAPTVPETTVPETTAPETTAPTEPVGIRPEFKEAMDAYEEFYDEYIKFMGDYKKNPADLSLLSKYADMLTKVEEMDKKFNAWEKGDMSNEELKYYLDVNARVLKKLGDLF